MSAPPHVMAQGPSDPAAFDSGAWDEFQELSNKYEPEATVSPPAARLYLPSSPFVV